MTINALLVTASTGVQKTVYPGSHGSQFQKQHETLHRGAGAWKWLLAVCSIIFGCNNIKQSLYLLTLMCNIITFSVSIRSKAGSNIFTIYEIWQDEDQWKRLVKMSFYLTVYIWKYLFYVQIIWNYYSIWQNEYSFLKSSECKAFQHSKVDCLELPEQVSHLPIPGINICLFHND